MRTSRKLHPRLEGMESRALLSGAAGTMAAVAAPLVSQTIHLNGTITGSYKAHQANPDTPKDFNLFGSGHVGLKARTALTGNLHEGGFTTNPDAHGTIYLADAHGTITVKLKADPNGGKTGGLSDQYDYKIVGGTGAYKHADGHGSAVLTLDPSKPLTTHNAHGGTTQHGKFSLVFVG